MPPLSRYAPDVVVRVPADMPEAWRWVMDEMAIQEGDEGITWCGGETAEDVYGERTIRGYKMPSRPQPFRWVKVNANLLAAVRNMLDIETLNSGAECEWYAEEYGEDPTFPVVLDAAGMCHECYWCKCLDMRDRIDWWLDVHGFETAGWLRALSGPWTFDAEARWHEHYGDVRGPLTRAAA